MDNKLQLDFSLPLGAEFFLRNRFYSTPIFSLVQSDQMKASKTISEKRIEFLGKIGIKEFSVGEIKDLSRKFRKEVEIGWNRPRNVKPTTSDGGLLAILTGVAPVTPGEWGKVPDLSMAIAATYAGTNWVTSVIKKSHDAVKEVLSSATTFLPEKREFKFTEIAGVMALEIHKVLDMAEEKGFVSKGQKLPMGVSFGFPLKTSLMAYGIDAAITSPKPSKNWVITDWKEDQFYGLEVIKILLEKYKRELMSIYFDNDTKMVANNVHAEIGENDREDDIRRVGFVFGTGDNSCEGEVNLESGISSHSLAKDVALETMIKNKLVNLDDNIMEYFMGGDHLKRRVGVACELLELAGLLENGKKLGDYILESTDGAIVSKIASGDSVTLDGIIKRKLLTEKDVSFVSDIAKTVLLQAGQLIGMQIAVVTVHAGYSRGKEQIPVEGAVYHKGFGVKEKAREIIDILIPDNELKIIKASSLLGSAQFAMVQANKMNHSA